MKIPTVGAELFHAEGRTENDESNIRLSQFCELATKIEMVFVCVGVCYAAVCVTACN